MEDKMGAAAVLIMPGKPTGALHFQLIEEEALAIGVDKPSSKRSSRTSEIRDST
jgi:hypothetical protein